MGDPNEGAEGAEEKQGASRPSRSETRTFVHAGHLVRVKPSRQREDTGRGGSLLCPAGPDSRGRGKLKPHLGTQTAVPRPLLRRLARCRGQAPGEGAVRAARARVVGGAPVGLAWNGRRC